MENQNAAFCEELPNIRWGLGPCCLTASLTHVFEQEIRKFTNIHNDITDIIQLKQNSNVLIAIICLLLHPFIIETALSSRG